MKITPISGDLLLKLAIGAGAVWAIAYIAKKGVASLWATPGHVLESIKQTAREGGAAWQGNYQPAHPSIANMTGNTYSGPLVNNSGMDFGQLSG